MGSSSHWKATSGPQRVYDYLNGLQEEFDRMFNDSSATGTSPRRVNVYLGGLKVEFDLMALEIESLWKKEVTQAQELGDVRRNFVCERCSKARGTMSARGVVASPQSKSMNSPVPARRLFQPERFGKSSPRRGVVLSPDTGRHLTRRSTRRMALVRKLQSAIAHTQHSHTMSRLPSESLVEPDSGSKLPDWSVRFNNKVEKELDVEMAHVLYHGTEIRYVKFSQDGKYLAAGCDDGKAYIYDVQTGSLTRILRDLFAKEDIVRAVCFSRDGNYLATGSSDGNVYVWKINTRHVRNAFKVHNGSQWVLSLNFSPNDRLLLSASPDNTLRLWNMRDGAPKVLTEDNPTFIDEPCFTSAVFSPDGRSVAASHRDGMVRIWFLCTGQLIKRVMAHVDWAWGIAFMPDGKGFMSGGGDDTVRYWDNSSLYTQFRPRSQAMNGPDEEYTRVEGQTRPDREFLGHEDAIYSVAISPDGKWVASGSLDKSVRIWNTHSAAMQCHLSNDQGRVYSVDFSPAGCYLASGGDDGTVGIWSYSYSTPGGPTSRLHPGELKL